MPTIGKVFRVRTRLLDVPDVEEGGYWTRIQSGTLCIKHLWLCAMGLEHTLKHLFSIRGAMEYYGKKPYSGLHYGYNWNNLILHVLTTAWMKSIFKSYL